MHLLLGSDITGWNDGSSIATRSYCGIRSVSMPCMKLCLPAHSTHGANADGKELHEHCTVERRAIFLVAPASATAERTSFRFLIGFTGNVLTQFTSFTKLFASLSDGVVAVAAAGVVVAVAGAPVTGGDDSLQPASTSAPAAGAGGGTIIVSIAGATLGSSGVASCPSAVAFGAHITFASRMIWPFECRSVRYNSFCCRILKSRSAICATSHIHRDAIAPRSTAHRQLARRLLHVHSETRKEEQFN